MKTVTTAMIYVGTWFLKPGRRNKQNNVASLLKKIVRHLRKQWPNTMLIVRGDSHFASKDFMQWCTAKPMTGYITGLSGNKKLHQLAAVTIESAERKHLFKCAEYANATFKTIQNKVIKTAAWVKEMKTKIKVEFPKSCTTKELQVKAFEMLCLLRT